MAGPIELRREQSLGERHAHGVGETLPQWPGRRFHARRYAHLGMAWRHRVQLPEALYFIERERIAAQMQQRVLQHRAVPVGQDEAVAIWPMRVGRVVTK